MIFYNRYFHKLISGIEPERWLTLDCEIIEKVHFHYLTKYGMIEKKVLENRQGGKRGKNK